MTKEQKKMVGACFCHALTFVLVIFSWGMMMLLASLLIGAVLRLGNGRWFRR